MWIQFKKAEIDIVTYVPHTTHISHPLDRGVFEVLKLELSNNHSSLSSTSSSAKRTAIADVLPQALHTAFTPSVIKKPSSTAKSSAIVLKGTYEASIVFTTLHSFSFTKGQLFRKRKNKK